MKREKKVRMSEKMIVLIAYRRAIMCRRAVRVHSQLKSHKRFANAFNTYCHLVDNARLYCTNALEGPPKVHSSDPPFCSVFQF